MAEWAPLVAFATTYVLTCLLGAVLMLLRYEPFIELYEYFSGTAVPVLDGNELFTALLLLFVAPLLVVGGYWSALRVLPRRPSRTRACEDGDRRSAFLLAHALFWLCAAVGIGSLIRSGALANVSAWTNYDAWIEARASGFGSASFFEFVNLYLFIPLAAAWVLIERAPVSNRLLRVLLRLGPAALAIALSLLLFQRKAAIVTLLLVAAAGLVNHSENVGRIQARAVAALVLVISAVYVTTVIVPVYGGASSARIDSQNIRITNSKVAIGLYAALSPITRTAAPALFYPVVFPDERRFYGLDVGQDVLGVGAMPDDNVVVWQVMNPEISGTTAAPFQFALYSQVGVLRSLLLCLVAGAALAASWRLAREPRWRPEWQALAGSLVLLLSVYLAIDSLRNGTIVSYGVVWGFAFLLVIIGLSRLSRFRIVSPPPADEFLAVSQATGTPPRG